MTLPKCCSETSIDRQDYPAITDGVHNLRHIMDKTIKGFDDVKLTSLVRTTPLGPLRPRSPEPNTFTAGRSQPPPSTTPGPRPAKKTRPNYLKKIMLVLSILILLPCTFGLVAYDCSKGDIRNQFLVGDISICTNYTSNPTVSIPWSGTVLQVSKNTITLHKSCRLLLKSTTMYCTYYQNPTQLEKSTDDIELTPYKITEAECLQAWRDQEFHYTNIKIRDGFIEIVGKKKRRQQTEITATMREPARKVEENSKGERSATGSGTKEKKKKKSRSGGTRETAAVSLVCKELGSYRDALAKGSSGDGPTTTQYHRLVTAIQPQDGSKASAARGAGEHNNKSDSQC
ncbi:hypothetical protein M0804_015599 [Polistes exclamans]|nr:hypothetical protein M0804_015599 [Polistes exclamans]